MDGTQFAQLLSVLFAREFEHSTDVDLIESLAPLNATTITTTYTQTFEILREALRENWSLPEFEQRLRRNADVAHVDVLLRFFKSHSVRMHESLAASHVWNDTLGSLAWRVDVKTKSRKVQQDLSDPTAIVELAVKHGAMSGATNKDTSTVRFEMNKAQVADIVRQLAQIERVLSQQQ